MVIGMPRPLRIEYPGAIYHVMSRGNQQVDDVLSRIVGVDNPIIFHPQPVAVVSFQAMMRKSLEPQSHLINLRFNARANLRRQFEKSGIEGGVIDLQRRSHAQGWRMRERILEATSRSDCSIAASNSGVNSSSSSMRSSSTLRIWRSSACDSVSGVRPESNLKQKYDF